MTIFETERILKAKGGSLVVLLPSSLKRSETAMQLSHARDIFLGKAVENLEVGLRE